MKNNFKILSLLVVFGFGCSHLEKPVVETASETPSFIKLDDDLPTYLEMNKRMPTALSVYKMTGQCGGLPRVEVKTAPGFCVGQIDAGDGLVFPRTALALPTGEILLVDMGGCTPMNGRIYLYKNNSAGGYTRSLLFNAKVINNPKFKKMVDRPNQISMGPDRKIYVGAPNAIVRFRMDSPDPQSTFEMVVDNIPNVGLHPLKAFTFDNENSLFVNLGSATNVCQKSGSLGDKLRNCPEVEENEKSQALVRKYRALPNGTYDPNYEIYSRGFRNSMVLLWDSYRQVLLQAENGRDAIDKFNPQLNTKKLPHEELNIVRPGKHYGWPYCYDNNLVNPEWAGHNCDHYEKPYLLLPPHSAPLSALLYQGNML
ncbi:MAG: sorbosone dehydrogenase family protein, partial [Pseudobdellovibrionaceae bacterium]